MIGGITAQHGTCSDKRYLDSHTHIGDRICHGLGRHNDRGQQTVKFGIEPFKNSAVLHTQGRCHLLPRLVGA